MNKLSKPKYYFRFRFSLKFYTRNNINIPDFMVVLEAEISHASHNTPVLTCRLRVFASLLHTQLVKFNLASGLGSPLTQNFKANLDFQSNFTFDIFLWFYFGIIYILCLK